MNKDDNKELRLASFVFFIIFTVVLSVVMTFAIFIKGWGMSIESWFWLIFLWICLGVNDYIKGKVIAKIEEM